MNYNYYYFFGFCIFFGLIFVIKGVPGGVRPVRGVFRGVLGHVSSALSAVPGVFRACSWFYRHPIVAWTPDPGIFITKTLFFDHASFKNRISI